MSNLLEQAIIDANALRETALKSAKSALIDKYKDEFQETLDKLLEQEELGTNSVPPEQNLGGVDSPDMSDPSIEQENPGGESFENIPSSFLDGDDDELITIDFDKIEKQLQDTLSSPILAYPEQGEVPEMQDQSISPETSLTEDLEISEEADNLEEEYFELEEMDDAGGQKSDTAKDALYSESENKINISISPKESDSEEEYELEEMGQSNAQQIAAEKGKIANSQAAIAKLQKADADMAAQQSKQPSAEDNASDEITEEEIQELDEEMHVDIDVENLMTGNMGASYRKKKELRDLELASARDMQAEEERKKQEEEIGDLKNKLEESRKQNKNYLNNIQELKENLNILREHTEKLSVSNAKLLYINKVFGNSSLNERQKEYIVESISKAQTVLEAKTIYGTLQSTVQSVVDKHKESLSEALNRGSSSFISRPKQSSIDDSTSERMKILAGIKNT